MEEVTIGAIIAIFEAMFGAFLFWFLVILAIAMVTFIIVLKVRNKRFKSEHYLWAKIAAPIGAIFAVLFMMWFNNSGFHDLGGPIDVILVLFLAIGGAIAAAMVAYLAQYLKDTSKVTA